MISFFQPGGSLFIADRVPFCLPFTGAPYSGNSSSAKDIQRLFSVLMLDRP
jgi:hypothetical protein